MAYIRGASGAAALALLFVPVIWDSFTAYQLGRYLLYGMVAQGIALCWGRAGFLPLGQALYFGLGAYIAGAVLRMDPGWGPILLAFLASILLPSVLAAIVGVLAFNRQIGSGPYFSLITLALSMLGFQVATSAEWLTGGFNGMTGIAELPGIDTYEHLFFVIVAALLASTLFLDFCCGLHSAVSSKQSARTKKGCSTSVSGQEISRLPRSRSAGAWPGSPGRSTRPTRES